MRDACRASQQKKFSSRTTLYAAALPAGQQGLLCRKKGKNMLRFIDYQRQMKVPFVIYADFESIIEKFGTCIPPTDKSSTTKTEIHKPCGASFVAVKSDSSIFKEFLYRGEDCVEKFLMALIQTEAEIREALKHKGPLHMTGKKSLFHYNERDETEFWHPKTGEYYVYGIVHKYTKAPRSRSSCYSELLKIETQDDYGNYIIKKWAPRKKRPEDAGKDNDCLYCDRPLLRERYREAVKDHCHITGKFRGAAHNACNWSYFRIHPKTP